MIRSLLTCLVVAAPLALPAQASPLPLTTAPGGTGSALRFRLDGVLGRSGLQVKWTPTMLLVSGVAADSPAALADVPSPTKYRVRIAAIDGEAVEEMALPQLLEAFSAAHHEVKLTLGRKTESDLTEILVGPFTVPTSTVAMNRQRAGWLAARQRFTEAREVLGEASPTVLSQSVLMEAYDAAAGGDHHAALKLTSGIGAADPLYANALRLRARVQEARAAEVITGADWAASRGDFELALTMLRSVTREGAWGLLRGLREADWKRALNARAVQLKESRSRRAQADSLARNAREQRRQAEINEAARKKRMGSQRPLKL